VGEESVAERSRVKLRHWCGERLREYHVKRGNHYPAVLFCARCFVWLEANGMPPVAVAGPE
jgi:hypothetical protein